MVKMLKVARRPILSETAAHPNRPTKLPEIGEKMKILFIDKFKKKKLKTRLRN
jgi:hypothetical protein